MPYEMRISDWSSDVCSSDLVQFAAIGPGGRSAPATVTVKVIGSVPVALNKAAATGDGQSVSIDLTDGATAGPFTAATIVSVTPSDEIGRASGRERVCQYV